jgi:hypothetical protein
MTPRDLDQQSIYLEPEKAAKLKALSDRTRIPKAVLLREAVDLLLGINGFTSESPQLDHWANNLMMCELALSKARHNEDIPNNVDAACAESIALIHIILEEWHRPKESRISWDRNPPIGANSHQAKKARRQKQIT